VPVPLAPSSTPLQRWGLVSRTALAGGVLEVVCWDGPRNLRVWLPPGETRQQPQLTQQQQQQPPATLTIQLECGADMAGRYNRGIIACGSSVA